MPDAPALAEHPQAGSLRARRLGVRGGGPAAPLRSGEWSLAEKRTTLAGLELEWKLEPRAHTGSLALRISNPRTAPTRLGSVVAGFSWAHDLEGLRLRFEGWHSGLDAGVTDLGSVTPAARVFEPPSDRAGAQASSNWTLIGNDRASLLAGVPAAGTSLPAIYARSGGRGVELDVEWRVEAELAPGASLALEPVELAFGSDGEALLETFAEGWGARFDARRWWPLTHGWRIGTDREFPADEEAWLRTLEPLARQSDRIDVIWLAPGYARAPGAWLETGPGFPGGLGWLVEQIRSAGFAPGIEIWPFHAGAAVAKAAGLPALPGSAFEGIPETVCLDPDAPSVGEHLRELAQGLVDHGFRHLHADHLDVWARRAARAPAAAVRAGLTALRQGAGDEACLQVGHCPFGAAVGLADRMEGPQGSAAVVTQVARAFQHRRLWSNALPPASFRDGAPPTSLLLQTAAATLRVPAEPLSAAASAALDEVLVGARAVDALGVPGVARVSDPLWREAVRVEAPTPDRDRACVVRFDPKASDSEDAASRLVRFEERARPVSLAVFCDFDGTFSVQDVGATLGVRYGGERQASEWQRYLRGEITPWQYNLEVLDGLPVDFAANESFLATIDLDPGANALLSWCTTHAIPFRILSDGFDWNLNRLQVIHGTPFAYTANHLRIEGGRWRIAPGSPSATCGCGTGTCKGDWLRRHRREHPGAHLVHIGNGRVSDRCGAIEADTAFAKDSLATALEAEGAPFTAYETLHDVVARLEALLGSER